jgi:hypothetical protein
MKTTNYLSSEQVSRFLTGCKPATIRELARRKMLPVDHWEPMFKRDAATIGALLSLVKKENE